MKIQPHGERRWRLTWELGRDAATGKRRQQTRVVRGTRKQAEKEWRRVQGEIDRGLRSPDPVAHTVADALAVCQRDRWPQLQTTTRQGYERHARVHILPALGSRPLRDLRARDLEEFYASLRATDRRRGPVGDGKRPPLAPRTVHGVHEVLRLALREAIRLEWITHDPTSTVRLPSPRRRELPTLSAAQWEAVWAALGAEPRAIAVWLAVATGLRQGEVLGLRWRDYDARARTITVAQSRKALPGAPVFGAPKTAASARTVAIDDTTVRRLAAHRAAQVRQRLEAGPAWADHDLICARADGRPDRGSTLTAWWSRRLAHAGLPHLRWHDLRHLHATVLLAAGVDVPTVARRLGHASPSVTMAIYGHVLAESDRAAATHAESYFTKAGDTPGDTAPRPRPDRLV